jgi:hypothetical protein
MARPEFKPLIEQEPARTVLRSLIDDLLTDFAAGVSPPGLDNIERSRKANVDLLLKLRSLCCGAGSRIQNPESRS